MSAKSAPNLHLFRRCWRCFWRWRRAASTLCHSASGPAQRCGLASKLSACEIWFELPRRSPNASNNWISSSTIINYLIYTYIYIYVCVWLYIYVIVYIYTCVCVVSLNATLVQNAVSVSSRLVMFFPANNTLQNPFNLCSVGAILLAISHSRRLSCPEIQMCLTQV